MNPGPPGSGLAIARVAGIAVGLAVGGLSLSCAGRAPVGPPERLSAWGLFADAALQWPASGVIAYDLNTPLFSDHAEKLRFVRLPEGTTVQYQEDGVLEFPVGTVIAKTFAYPSEDASTGGRLRLLETRLLVHEADGWVGLPYIWNDQQTEARLSIIGGRAQVVRTDAEGRSQTIDYLIPNSNQCKGCHRRSERTMLPIGPRVAQLNRDFDYPSGRENQLAHWARVGALTGVGEPAAAPRYPVWNDAASGSLDHRARAWLEINCAHCHNPEGPARTSNLDLSYGQTDPTFWGVRKRPIAAGRGSGDRLFDIVPGVPEESIFVYRLESLDPGVMMPELGRTVIHHESVELIREWIAAMADPAPVAVAHAGS